MFYEGHIGLALAAYTPFGATLARETFTPRLTIAAGGWTLGWALAPDIDSYTTVIDHRGPTHSVAFALLAGSVSYEMFAMVSSNPRLGFTLGTLGVLTHLAGDVLNPAGIQPWWPAQKHYTLNVCRAADQRANRLLVALGISMTAIAVVATLFDSTVLADVAL